ncbi:MAG: hypothetical protein R3C53_23515 [Pirellulaceae bacterium]
MPRTVLYALSLGLCLFSSRVWAQGALVEVYGEGVHRYFAGDLSGADQLFSEVINSGSEDPRAYYFRGLVRERQGGGGEYDFEQGARFEAEGKRSVDVGFALSRVQGHTRAKIEKARRDARVAASQQAMLMERARLDAAGAMQVPPPSVVPGATPPPAASDPFGSDEGMRSDATTVDPVQPSTPEVDADTNPFGDDPAPPAADTPTPDASNPFADPATPTPDVSNPFGDPDASGGTDLGNPFGT